MKTFAGSISEIVAKWLSSSGVDPIKLIDTTDIEFDRLHLIQELLKNEAHLQSTDVPELTVQSSLAPIETGSEAKDEEDTCLLQTTSNSLFNEYMFIVQLKWIFKFDTQIVCRKSELAEITLSVQSDKQRVTGKSLLGVRYVME